jgi:hypothetical protein
VTGRWGRHRQLLLLDDLKEKRGYLKLKEKALDCTLWRTRFGRVRGPVIRDYRMNERITSNFHPVKILLITHWKVIFLCTDCMYIHNPCSYKIPLPVHNIMIAFSYFP